MDKSRSPAAPGLRANAARTANSAAAGNERPIRVQFLGRFLIVRNGLGVAYGRKAPRKPLSLLKVLAAEGGRAVDTHTIAGILWPELEGDAACSAFEITLHRLRRILGIPGALRLSDHKLSLDPRLCETDTWRFEALVEEIDDACPDVDTGRAADCIALAQALLRAYPGHFLAEDTQEIWALAFRDRLREKFRRTVMKLGARLEQCKQWRHAANLYSRALELDNLAEPLYRRLMACYVELGETAEAIRAYRRCQELLAAILGVRPSPETESVRMRLAAQPATALRNTVPSGLED